MMSRAVSLLIALVSLTAPAATAQDDYDVRWSREQVTVHVSNAPRSMVLLKLARLAGIEISGLEQLTGSVSADVDQQSLQASLDVLLAGFNFILTEPKSKAESGATTFALRIVGPSTSAASGSRRQPILVPALLQMTSPSPDPPDADEEEQKRTDDQELSEELTEITRSGMFDADAPLPALIEAAAEHDNRMVRIKALEVLATRDASRALRPLLTALKDDDDEVAQEAVKLLAARDDAASLTRLGETVLKDSDSAARINALQVLALRADPACVPILKQLADDKDAFVKDVAGQILAEFAFREKIARSAAR